MKRFDVYRTNCVVWPSGNKRCDFCPFVAELGLHLEKSLDFKLTPLLTADGGINLVLPPLPALFACSASTSFQKEFLGNIHPFSFVFRTPCNHLQYDLVLLNQWKSTLDDHPRFALLDYMAWASVNLLIIISM